MVNFRYHIVSLVAVFLALAVGIVVGSTVVDRAIVNSLNDRLSAVEARADATAEENRRLAEEMSQLDTFAAEASGALVSEALVGVPVLVVTVQGVERAPLERLVEGLMDAAAEPLGTLSLTNAFLLSDASDVDRLAEVLGIAANVPDGLRTVALSRLGAVLAGTRVDPDLLLGLADGGFVTYDDPPGRSGMDADDEPLTLASLAGAEPRVILVSGAGARLADSLGAVPLALEMAEARREPALVAAEIPSESDDDAPPSTFVEMLRRDGSLGARLSTVDDIRSAPGITAAILAVRDLGAGRTGHYGQGPGAQRQLPTTGA